MYLLPKKQKKEVFIQNWLDSIRLSYCYAECSPSDDVHKHVSRLRIFVYVMTYDYVFISVYNICDKENCVLLPQCTDIVETGVYPKLAWAGFSI